MTTSLSGEPTPIRDNGPYFTAAQARAQWDAVTYGIPTTEQDMRDLSRVVVAEVLMMTSVTPIPEFEQDQLKVLAGLDPETVQVYAGWLVRAWKAGRDSR